MIWSRGEIISDDALRVSVLDRTFEHGLGLFETLRTWNGHATLLERHLVRLRRSAAALGLRLEPADEPDVGAVRRLHRASETGADVDIRIRITLSGGPDDGPSSLWMTAAPLGASRPEERGVRIGRTMLADPEDPLARHKTLNYWRRRIEHAKAVERGDDEVLCVTPQGLVCEGTRANIFLVERRRLLTPGLDGPLLEGVMRGVAIEQARLAGIEVREDPLSVESIACADEAFLTNSVRGLVPVAHLLGTDLPAPGPVTVLLRERVLGWLTKGGILR
jgi:branched-chain amino acid aminotransferase